eukprot:4083035-Ditylum_brightwellii.AAC.1
MADRRTVEDLSKANKELAEANRQHTSQMEQINKKFADITKLIEVIPTTRNNTKGGRFTNQRWQPVDWDQHGYCWSCGYKVDKNTTVLHASRKKMGIKMWQQGQTLWEVVRLKNHIVEKEERQVALTI